MLAVSSAFASVVERMEQHAEEIWPFAEWLAARAPHHVVEIGVRWGGTAALWHQIATGTVVGVDWLGRDSLGAETSAARDASMQARYPRYRVIIGDSQQVATKATIAAALRGELVDFLFIDGDHSLAGVRRDWELYRPMVRDGGCVAFHDIVDSEHMRRVGHGVPQFWRELQGRKTEFCVGRDWGGIGVVEL